MIAHVRGRLISRGTASDGGEARVVVDVGGVGYLVLVPANLTSRLPGPGDEVELHTSLQVREDSMTLYGFPTVEARDLFDLLLTASGVGPKLSLAALATHRPDVLRSAIATEDLETLKLIPGIGAKSAQRVVFELRDRIGDITVEDGRGAPVEAGDIAPGIGEVRLALSELGYSATEVREATADLDPDEDTAELLRTALRSLSQVAAR